MEQRLKWKAHEVTLETEGNKGSLRQNARKVPRDPRSEEMPFDARKEEIAEEEDERPD